MTTIYDYEALTVEGEPQSLSEFKGKVFLVVNTASKCGFTPQFEDLQKLHSKYKDQGFTILGFPCNQFHAQEPGTNEDAVEFCKRNYGVDFPVFSKVDVNGPKAHPLFQFLKREQPFQGFDETTMSGKIIKNIITEHYPEWLVTDDIKWNFTKFLVDREGTIIKRYEPTTEPMDFEQDIQAVL
ncbi:MAG: glutathione peroxidase [Bacillaceae bacterium]|nr:glutathione peroxidase [Bacillaceae bacterium]